jgi:hypothetical protein
MPWTVADVERHKKGLTPTQKKKWVKIANGVLKKCQADGGSDCEGKAIRIANSKFAEEIMEKISVPRGALRLAAPECNAHVFAEEGQKPKMKMTVYSGGIITGHWYWGNLAIDLKGVKFDRSKYPVLEQHDTAKKIAFSGRPKINGAITLDPNSVTFVDTKESQEFQKLSQEGFPYQASIYAVPSSIEWVERDETAEVNGFSLKGPGAIWRKCLYQEASVCVFGWDKKTEASAFSRKEQEEIEAEQFGENIMEGGEIMPDDKLTLEQLKAKYPELVTALTEEVRAALSEEIRVVIKAEYEQKETAMQAQITDLSGKLDESNKRTLELEKKDSLRAESELKHKAERIWTDALNASEVAEHLHDKIRKHVSYVKFVKDGILDVEAFKKAVNDEITDWVSRGATTSVLGTGFVKKDEIENNEAALEKQDDDMADSLLSLAGQEQNNQ